MKLLALGSRIDCNGYKGIIAAVGWVGERYYWLILDDGTVAMIPASTLLAEHGVS